MKQLLSFLLRFFMVTMLLFLGQKAVFMVFNASYGEGLAIGDWLAVLWHGMRLDLVVTCYLMVIPILVTAVAAFIKRCSLRKWLSWWYVIAGIAMSLAFLADMVLYNYWGSKLDVADLIYARNPQDLLASFTWWQLLGIFAGVLGQVLIVLWVWFWATPKCVERCRKPMVYFVLALLLLGADFVGMRGGINVSTANPSYAYFSDNKYLNHAALNPFFNILNSMSKTEKLDEEFVSMSEVEMQRLTKNLFSSSSSIADTLLSNRRPNIILLIWEGGGSLMTENDSVAPCFGRMKEEGVFFTNCYANNFRTDRGLVSILNGWLALPTTSVMKMSGLCGKLPSIARHLKSANYNTAFYYGGDIDFTNMRGYLYETDYDKVCGIESFGTLPTNSKWGVHDEHFLDMKNFDFTNHPFFVTLLTLSSHEPWTVPYRKLIDDRANSFAYADSCIGVFVENMKKSELWDNLLLIIVPDHGVGCNGVSVADIRASRIPMLWLGGAIKKPQNVDCLMNQSDLAATLMAQMGLSADDFIFSRNVLNPNYRPTVVMHAFKNGFNLMDSIGCTQYECLNGQVVPAGKDHSPNAELQAKALMQMVYSRTGRL